MTEREPVDDTNLAAELVRAGRTVLVEPPADDLVANVLTALGPASRRRRRPILGWWSWLRARRRRLVVAMMVAVLLVAALTPPVRAAVAEWLQIGGVLIRTGPPPATTLSPGPRAESSAYPAPPVGSRELTLDEARAAVDFPVGVPNALGAPDRVTVTTDGRVVGMDWMVDGRPVHLDQFDGTVSWVFLKQNWSIVTPTDVDGADAAWLAEPHEIVYVDRSGVERRETARLSSPCLIWQPLVADRRTTARLEGIAELVTARSIAESLR